MRIIGDRLFIDLPGSGEPSPDGRIDGGTAWGTHLTDIAATGLLLGTTSDMETVAMMLDVSKRVADPGVIDAESGRNAWTSAYEQLEHDVLVDLDQVRAAGRRRACGDPPAVGLGCHDHSGLVRGGRGSRRRAGVGRTERRRAGGAVDTVARRRGRHEPRHPALRACDGNRPGENQISERRHTDHHR